MTRDFFAFKKYEKWDMRRRKNAKNEGGGDFFAL